jgi:hypothetical protein
MIIRPHIVVVVLWLGCRCCRPSVNTICGHIMIGLSLSSVSKHNMWSYYDSVDNNENPMIIRPHIVFTDRRERQPNHNATTYCVYWQKTINPIIIRCLPSVTTICGHIMIGLSLLSSVSKHNMWSYYDWVVVVFDGRQRQPNHNTTTYCVYWRKTTTTTQS